MSFRLGLHAPTSGALPEFMESVATLPARLLVWTISEQVGDAEHFPDAAHIFRVPTPWPGENPQSWLNRVAGAVNPWMGANLPPGSLMFQLGNEPEQQADGDVPNAWDLDAWLAAGPTYAAAFRSRYPEHGTLSAPLRADNTARLKLSYVSAFHGVAIHGYWSEGNPGWRQGLDGGASWRVAAAFDMPIYVTEVNSNPTSVDEMLAWLGEAGAGGELLMGAAWFISASPQSFPKYNVTLEQVAQLGARWNPTPSPVNPPNPPLPEPPPATYTVDWDPRGYRPLDTRWRDFIGAHNPGEVIRICATLDATARAIDYDANVLAAQFCVETAIGTSQRWRNSHNAAGIGIFADSTPDIIWGPLPNGDVETGIHAQGDLLTCYYGNGEEPFGTLAPHGFGGFTRHYTRLSDLTGHWAMDPSYAATMVRYLNDVVGTPGPEPAPTPVPTPAPAPPTPQQYPMVRPVDDAILQGSDGDFSHGGVSPGFYAIDFACARGTPVRAIADGTVGVTYWTDSNPISKRTGHSMWIDHTTGYSTFSCHLSQFMVATGDTVKQGQVIGLSGSPTDPNNGYGTGPHLHWEVWDTARHVRVKMEDLEAAGLMGPYNPAAVIRWRAPMAGTGYDGNEQKRQWFGTNTPTKTAQRKYPYNPTFGIPMAYGRLLNGTFGEDAGDMQDLRGLSIALGPATSGEEEDPGTPGRIVQYYTCGKITAFKQPDGSYKFQVG